jgi:hypothetical protein
VTQLTLRESRLTVGRPAELTRTLRSYEVTGLPPGHAAIIRQLPAGGWRLLVAKPGKTLEIRGEFLTAEAALARAQLDYDTILW